MTSKPVRRSPVDPAVRVNLHLGCGRVVVPGWENVDKSPSVYLARVPALRRTLGRIGVLKGEQVDGFPKGVVRADVSKRIPYPDESARYVYCSHLIEHMSRWQALDFVRECRRVLEPGGILRIATPDLAEMVRVYLDGSSSGRDQQTGADRLMTELGMFHEIQANVFQRLIRRLISGAPHQWLYDAESLMQLLREGGFSGSQLCRYRDGALPDLELLEHRPDSLFVEAE